MKLIKTDQNVTEGITLNAKGDFLGNLNIDAGTISAGPAGTSSVTISNSGAWTTVTTGGSGSWVQTGAGWVGGSNYTISVGAPNLAGNLTGLVASPSGAVSWNLGTSRTFSASYSNAAVPKSGTVDWAGTITNIATGATMTIEMGCFIAVEPAEGGGCFGAGTIVTKADSSKVAIEDIVVGDVLVAYSVPNRIDESDPNWINWTTNSINDGFYTTSTVTQVGTHEDSSYYTINGSLIITGSHRLLIYNASAKTWGWSTPEAISAGDFMYNETESITFVSSVVRTDTEVPITYYNINVEDVDTFMVEVNGISVVAHNLLKG